jgi:hypothetical protein
MKNYIKYSFIAFISMAFAVSSCDILDSQLPQEQLAPEQVWVDNSSVQAALIGAYSSLQSANYYGLRFFAFAGMSADEISWTGTFPTFGQIANRQVLANNVELTNYWNVAYAGINRANNIIANVPGITDAALNKDVAIAEARFLRALHYMGLLSWFGGTPTGFANSAGLGVPLITTPTITPGDAVPQPRATEAEVWALINSDLEFAIEKLPVGGVARANKNAAIGLKARAALYQGDWAEAEARASSIITGTGSDLLPIFADLFLAKNSSESLFELQFDPVNSNTIAFFFFPTSRGGRNELAPSIDFLAAHQVGDARLRVNNGSAAPNPAAGTSAKHFRITGGDDNVIILRKGEMYLIAAEAAAKANAANLDKSNQLINAIRNRAGLAPVTATSVQEVEDFVINERRFELAFEGHRWFDLRRTNRVVSLFNIETFRALMPIPEREVLTSDGVIAQNPNY